MKPWLKYLLLAAVLGVSVAVWILHFHNEAVASCLPKWSIIQKPISLLGEKKVEAQAEDEDPDTALNQIPVHSTHITVATMHRYVEGFGIVAPRPSRAGQMAGGSNLASPIAGVVAKVLCQIGQPVHMNDPLIQLDDRLAKAAEEQADAALAQARASQASVKANPRPDQLQIAQLAVDKAQAALDFAQKNYERQKRLGAEQSASSKTVEQAALDLAAAQNDHAVSLRQLAILRASPTPEDLAQEQAKVAQATAASAAAHTQRQLLTIVAPIDGTIVSLNVNPGESVDMTRTLVGLVAMDRLMVDIDVPVDQLPANAEGLSALIIPSSASQSAFAEKAIVGKVSFVTPQVASTNGAVMIGIDLPAVTPLRPGQSVRVRIVAEEHKDALVVPREAVVADENGDSVIAVVETKDGHSQATRKTVKAGFEEDGMIEIQADGLKEGLTVVTAGAFGLPQAGRVKILE